MTLTPSFSLSQTDEDVTLTLRLPHVRVVNRAECRVVPEPVGRELLFHCAPYFLRLELPGDVVDDAGTTPLRARYDPDEEHGTLRVTATKSRRGETFPDLDLVTRLLTPKRMGGARRGDGVAKRLVRTMNGEEDLLDDDDDDDENDDVDVPSLSALRVSSYPYGFAGRLRDSFRDHYAQNERLEFWELTENPETTSPEERARLRVETEALRFDPDRYLADNAPNDDDDEHDDDYYSSAAVARRARATVPPWEQRRRDGRGAGAELTREETDALARVPHLVPPDRLVRPTTSSFSRSDDSLATIPERNDRWRGRGWHPDLRSHLLSLLDVLFAHAYDHRVTEGEPTVESPRTIAILSPTLSWLESWPTLVNGARKEGSTRRSTWSIVPSSNDDDDDGSEDGSAPEDPVLAALSASVRRACVYPLCRDLALAVDEVVRRDLPTILSGGRRAVLRCLSDTRAILETSDVHYRHNAVWIDGAISWIQRLDEDVIARLAADVREVADATSTDEWKRRTRLGLEELERAYYETDTDTDTESDDEDTDTEQSNDDGNDKDEAVEKNKLIVVLDSKDTEDE